MSIILSYRTKAKWSLKILESCERVRSNTLRINFDTMRKDKQERIYCVENTLCQVSQLVSSNNRQRKSHFVLLKELEKKLRDILSQRDLTEMNISIYRCVNCLTQFTIEQKSKRYKAKGEYSRNKRNYSLNYIHFRIAMSGLSQCLCG